MTDRDALLERAVEALRWFRPKQVRPGCQCRHCDAARVLADYDAMRRAEAAELERTRKIMGGAGDA